MKIGQVGKVEVVGEVSNRLLKSASMVGIWGDREGMITTIWDNYKKKDLEKVLNDNRKTEQDLENYKNGFISETEWENGKETISWVETYTFFPCLHDLPNEDPEQFFKEIEEPYNYHATFLLEHYAERRLIFNHLESGLSTWDWVVGCSLRTFAPYSKPALLLLEKFYDLGRFLRAQEHTYSQALQEVRNGKKISHWIWYIFPQMKGLGKSELSLTYGITWRDEAEAYIVHPILRERLIEISEAVLNNEKSVYDIFGQDAIKVRACILLFASVSDIPVFKQLKSKYRW